MDTKENRFHIVIPADLEKSSDGDWIIQGLASTPSRDQQGEVILPDGIDPTPIDQKRGILNWDHQRGPENTIGTIDSYLKSPQGFFIKGRLFKNHTKAKAVHEIMTSLGKSDRGRMGLSVEGKILERGGPDGKIIKKCQINAVALTLSPVNQDSYVDLVKSLSVQDVEVDFNATKEGLDIQEPRETENPVFTAAQVVSLLEKALSAASGYTKPPAERSGGDALSQESLDEKEEVKPKRLKKMSKELYKSTCMQLLDSINKLYPDVPKDVLWEALKERLNKKFPDLRKM